MPARTAPGPSLDDLDNYNVELFDDDDPFRSPSPKHDQQKQSAQNGGASKKRKKDGLGIDEEVDLTKPARAPRVKLDETKLLSEDGIPKLRKRARDLKFKGKGHEFTDASRLLSFYQFWLDDLFPKAKFLDALAMVEKAGHKRALASQRVEWINEGKPKSSVFADDDDDDEGFGAADGQTNTAACARTTPMPTTATRANNNNNHDGVPDDEGDLWGATPMRPKAQLPTNGTGVPDEDGEDDLDALMAEAEADSATRRDAEQNGESQNQSQKQAQTGSTSASRKNNSNDNDDGMDDLDALMAEAEAQQAGSGQGGEGGGKSRNTSGGQGQQDDRAADDAYADDEAAIADMGGLW